MPEEVFGFESSRKQNWIDDDFTVESAAKLMSNT